MRSALDGNESSALARAAIELRGSVVHFLIECVRTKLVDSEILKRGGDFENASMRLAQLEQRIGRLIPKNSLLEVALVEFESPAE